MQMIPKVSWADVERIIQRDYVPQLHGLVRTELGKYPAMDGPERHRVHLAILRLAGAEFKKIEQLVAEANIDYRDILCRAEYPRSTKLGWRESNRLTEEDKRRIDDDDWQDYQAWFTGGTRFRLNPLE